MAKFVTEIRPPSGFSLGVKELWQYRELFYFFTWRDIKVKYKQTYLGIVWAMLQPLGLMLIFTFLFSKTWKIDTGNIPYPVFVLSGLILWNFFNNSVSHAAESMFRNAHILSKIYFPRLVIPSSAVLVALFDFMIGLAIFIVISLIYKQPIHWSAIYYFPAAILLSIIASFGLGSLLSALNVKYRDFRYAIPFGLQFLFFATQVFYSMFFIHESTFKYLLSLNPMNAAIELFRAPMYEGSVDITVILIGTGTALLTAFCGLYYFRKTESHFADIV
jgi:lipopolysaccharide transport system permease protein